jgi:predicted phage baseplate assembly protein
MVAGVTQTTTAGAADTPHTVLQLAAPLTFSYQLASVQIYGNVVPARQGATITEPLGGTQPGDPNPAFTLSQAPVLADPSATTQGSVSSLTLRVGGRTWTAVARLDLTTPPRSYLTGIDSQGRTTIELSSPLPTGVSSVVATYRSGQGGAGNVRAHQLTQLLSRPLTVSGVDNPLPASGGSDGDGPDDLRGGAAVGLVSLGRLVSVADAADLVRSWAGVGKAKAQASGAGGVTVTVAGVDPVALDPAGTLCTSLTGALTAAGDPGVPVAVVPARLYLIVLAARVRRDATFDWTAVSAGLQAALFAAFGYGQRGLDQDLVISEVIAVAHSVPGVESMSVIAATLIPTTATAAEIDALTSELPPPPANGRLALPVGGAVSFLSPAMSDTLILQQVVG